MLLQNSLHCTATLWVLRRLHAPNPPADAWCLAQSPGTTIPVATWWTWLACWSYFPTQTVHLPPSIKSLCEHTSLGCTAIGHPNDDPSTRAFFHWALHCYGRCSEAHNELVTWDLCSPDFSASCSVNRYPVCPSATCMYTRSVLRWAFPRDCRTVVYFGLMNPCSLVIRFRSILCIVLESRQTVP